MSKPGAERARPPQDALSEGEHIVDVAFEDEHPSVRDSKEYQSLLRLFQRVDSGRSNAITIEEFDAVLDPLLEHDPDRSPTTLKQRIEAAQLFDKDMKAGLVAPETYAAKRHKEFVEAETEPEIAPIGTVEMSGDDETRPGERSLDELEEADDKTIEVDLEALDEADVERARRHPIYKFLLDRLQKAAEGNGDAESVMEEVASSKESAPTSVNQENVVAATEQFEADLNGPLAELWQQALKQDMQGEARAAAKVEAQINPAAERSVARERKGRERTTEENFRWFAGVNINAQRVYRELLEEYRADTQGMAPTSEKLFEYQTILKEKIDHAKTLEEKSALETFANDLERGVVQNIVDTFESEDTLVEEQMRMAIEAAKEQSGRHPEGAPDAVKRVAELNTDQMMQLYAAQKQLDTMGFFAKTFGKAGRAAKQARKEFESLSALMASVANTETKDEEIIYQEVSKRKRLPTFESLQTEWPQEVNSILGALKMEELSPQEAVNHLDDLNADTITAWTGTLKGKTLQGVKGGNGQLIGKRVTIGRVDKNKSGTLKIDLRDRDGKRYTMNLATFLKHNIAPVEREEMRRAA